MKKNCEKRKFVDIYAGLTDIERSLIRERMIADLQISRGTLWHWITGKHAPCKSTRPAIAAILEKCLKVKVSPHTLF